MGTRGGHEQSEKLHRTDLTQALDEIWSLDLLLLADGGRLERDNYKTGRSYLWKARAIMGKVMISLTDEAEELVRDEVGKLYFGRTGGFSIFFEQLIRQYFNGHMKEKKSK